MAKVIDYTIPESWNGLNNRQRSQISHLVLTAKSGDKGVFMAVLYYLFCPNRWFSFKGIKQLWRFSRLIMQTGITQLIPFTDFIFKELKLTNFPKRVKVKGKWYYGPANRLVNVTIEELAFADKFFYEWRVNGSMVDLDRLVTTLYRPLKKGAPRLTDDREPFNEFTVADRGQILPLMNEKTKYAIGLAYQGSRELIISRYPTLFPKPKKEPKAKNEKPKKYQGFSKLVISMAMGENLPLGPLQEVKKTLANTFFDIVQENIIAARKRKEELKKLKKKNK